LEDDRPIYGFQSRGFAGEPAPDRIEAIAADYLESLRAIQPEGPYLLIGYSMGGTIAYEMARQLGAQRERVAFLGLIDSDCRASVPAERQTDGADWDDAARGMGLRLDGDLLERLVSRGPDELSSTELERVLASGLGPPGTTLEELRPLVPVLRANFQAFWQYRPPPQATRLTFFRACEPMNAGVEAVGVEAGWRRIAPVDVELVPGLHHTVVREPHVRVLADRLRVCLGALDTKEDSGMRASSG
jgi:thioesterase domain-containing protein